MIVKFVILMFEITFLILKKYANKGFTSKMPMADGKISICLLKRICFKFLICNYLLYNLNKNMRSGI